MLFGFSAPAAADILRPTQLKNARGNKKSKTNVFDIKD